MAYFFCLLYNCFLIALESYWYQFFFLSLLGFLPLVAVRDYTNEKTPVPAEVSGKMNNKQYSVENGAKDLAPSRA